MAMPGGLCRSAAGCGELVERRFCYAIERVLKETMWKSFVPRGTKFSLIPIILPLGSRKNGLETWQIFSAKIGGAKTPQRTIIAPRIHHQKSSIAHHFFAKTPEKQPFSPAYFFVSAREQQQSLQAQPGRTLSEEPRHRDVPR